ncbi:MAG: polymer-forming cytoskeletal protein [Candidatus Krumholzibacteria bacterium]|nr:polymer-forming cytoskeletal protein [Candidatus Krumholzibacteria bacterium]
MADEGKMNSIIGKGCKVNGTIDVQDGTLRIDGDFEGNVNCPGGTLVIGKGGKVKADIKVSNAVVGGTVNGNIDAKEKIELQAGSRLEGDIKTRRLVIDEGVFFEGSCKMSPDGKPMASAVTPPEVKKEEKEKTGAWNK